MSTEQSLKRLRNLVIACLGIGWLASLIIYSGRFDFDFSFNISQDTKSALFFFLKVGLFGFLVCGVPYLIHRWLLNARRDKLAAWAASRGLAFLPDGADEVFHCLPKALHDYADTTPEIYNVAHGKSGSWDICAFDVLYQTKHKSSKGRTRYVNHRCSMVAIELSFSAAPLYIRPTAFFDRVKQAFGFDDINVESAEFSRRYHVSAENRKWAVDFLCPAVVEFLLKQRNFNFEAHDKRIVVHDSLTSKFSTEEFDEVIGMLTGMCSQMDKSLIKELSQDQTSSPNN